jgi:hypothetical protein
MVENRPGKFGAGIVDTPPHISHATLDLVARDKEGKIDGNDQLEGGGTRTTTHGTGRVVATDGVYIILTAEGYLTISKMTPDGNWPRRGDRSLDLHLRHCVLTGARAARSGLMAELDQEVSEGELVTLMLWSQDGIV